MNLLHSRLYRALLLALPMAFAHPSALALPMAGNTPAVLSFGVGNSGLGDVGRHADMPIGYRYQYFAGGLGADDWRHWSVPDGAFADLWLNETREAGLTPVITYYELVHAAPYVDREPPFDNMRVPATMKAYFDNWIFLLQRIAAFGDPVVVHIEPDLFGSIQWNDPDPAKTPVSVAASGHPLAAGYEDNARGFFKLMVALRDQYAPNAILGWHVSTWATRIDLIPNHGDPDELAVATAEFYRRLEAPFDVLFAEFGDRDAAFYQKDNPDRWWTPDEFEIYRRFVARLSSELHQEVVMWQIPIGNTLYRSCGLRDDQRTDDDGHYQDNRAEFFLQPVLEGGDMSRLAQYRDAGVVAFLFGAGRDDQTHYYDAMDDGITNPAPVDNRAFNHTDHLNDRVALSADDDGGFLRAGIQGYYALGALPLASRPAPACADGLDNDGDGLTDFPADPGCASASDNDEMAALPACSDGLDNDHDGLVDFPADPGCLSADDNGEYNPPPPTAFPAQLRVSADWGNGYCADVRVTNTADETLEWITTFPVDGTIVSLWNASHSQTGDQASAVGLDWNKVLAAGASADFGFCAERPAAPAAKPQCADGLDNDGDGLADFPADPGCLSTDDDDETDAVASPLQTTLKQDADWGSGYCATVTVNNPGSTAQVWNVSLSVEGRIDDLWNAQYSQTGGTLSAWGYDWNAAVAAGGSRTFGFCASR